MSENGGGRLKKVCAGCGTLIALGMLMLSVANISSSGALDTRFADVKSEVAERRANAAKPRPLLVKGTVSEGNAAVYYQGLQWAFGEGISPMKTTPPSLPAGAEEDRAEFKDREYDFLLQKELEEHMDGGPEPSAEALEMFRAYSSRLHYMRDGLRQNVCDWGLQYERGYAYELPNIVVLRATALLASYEAFLSKAPARALTIGAELLAFAADIARNPALISGLIAISVESIAIKSLERTLASHGYDAAAYDELLQLLEHLPEHSMREYTKTERLAFEIHVLNMSGRRLDPQFDPTQVSSDDKGLSSMGSYFINRELNGMDEFLGKRARELMAKPYTERKALAAQFEADVNDSSYLLVRMAMPNIVEAQDQFDIVHAQRGMLRMLLAAHRHRLDSGSFPAKATALSEHLGGTLPTDPLHPDLAPIHYTLDGETLRIYSVGEDMKDDGGAREGASIVPKGDGDIVLLGSVPK